MIKTYIKILTIVAIFYGFLRYSIALRDAPKVPNVKNYWVSSE